MDHLSLFFECIVWYAGTVAQVLHRFSRTLGLACCPEDPFLSKVEGATATHIISQRRVGPFLRHRIPIRRRQKSALRRCSTRPGTARGEARLLQFPFGCPLWPSVHLEHPAIPHSLS